MMNSQKFNSIKGAILTFVVLSFFPLLTKAEGLVPCGSGAQGQVTRECDFNDLVTTIQNVYNFIVFDLVTPLAVIMFAYAGFIRFFDEGDPVKHKKSNKIFVEVGLGYGLLIAATLIIKLIFSLIFGDKVPSLIG